tara:strand:+ start:1417 stop:1698 length:282 start_codon:yes stop_codon:yes gene_type:complete
MDYQNKRDKMKDWTCYCDRRFKDGEDPIFKLIKKLGKIKEGQTHRKYSKPEKIIDFNFKHGKKVAVMDKEKKPPTAGKMKMKTYGNMDAWTKL